MPSYFNCFFKAGLLLIADALYSKRATLTYFKYVSIFLSILDVILDFLFLDRSAIYANRNVLSLYHKTHPDLLAQNGKDQPHIIGKPYRQTCDKKTFA